MSAPTPSRPSGEELGALFERLQGRLRASLRRQVRDEALADDLLQEVFVKALASRGSGRPVRNLVGWIHAIARTTVADHFRAARPGGSELDENTPAAEREDRRVERDLAACLRPMVKQLPPLYRDTLLATDFRGRTMRALAEEQGLSVSAIKSRAARARVLLRDKLLHCCQVETRAGRVTDYRPRRPAARARRPA